jgi:molybdenum cofactor biosynthesis protein MoaC
MVDVSSKISTTRIALAQSKIKVSPIIMKALKENSIKKGDALSTARIAAILSAKKTSDLIPLCHQIPLSNVQVKFFFEENAVLIFSRVKTNWLTGVEMEALMSSTIAALVIYDMCKALGHDMKICDTKLIGKFGGKNDHGIVEFEKLHYKNLL